MNLPEGTHLAYIVWRESWWYGKDGTSEPPSVMISASAKGEGGGVAWEFPIEELELGGKPVTRAKIFYDAYEAFTQVPELFAALADGGGTTLAAVIQLLDMLGAVDETERTSPHASRQATEPGEEGPHAETIRVALQIAINEAPTVSMAARFTKALEAMGGKA